MMTTVIRRALDVRPVIRFRSRLVAGQSQLLEVDLRASHTADEWPFSREEYVLTCIIDPGSGCYHQLAGERYIVLNRFGGTFGPARFLITPNKTSTSASGAGEQALRLTLLDEFNIPIFHQAFPYTIAASAEPETDTDSALLPYVEVALPAPQTQSGEYDTSGESTVPDFFTEAPTISTLPGQFTQEASPLSGIYPETPVTGAKPPIRVFISHSVVDDAFGQRLAADLRAALGDLGRVWFDRNPDRIEMTPTEEAAQPGGLTGAKYLLEITEQIMASNAFVVILSPEAAGSQVMKYELSQAMRRHNSGEHIGIYPIIYRPVQPRMDISMFRMLNFQGTDTDPGLYRKCLDELVALISSGEVALAAAAPTFDLGLLSEHQRLIGRDEDLRWLLGRLRASRTPAITALSGMGGIGKSALAAVAIRQLSAEGAFPDGIAVVPCENQHDPVELLRQTLSFFTSDLRAPDADTIPNLASMSRELLAGKRALIVLDNLAPDLPVEQVTAPLAAAGATLLLTARHSLPISVVPADGVRDLGFLGLDDALQLFAQCYGDAGARRETMSLEERAAAARIVTALGLHPLAIRLAAANAATLDRSLADVARELENYPEQARLHIPGQAVTFLLEWSAASLASAERRLLGALAGFATGDIGHRAAQAVAAALKEPDPDASLSRLLALRLVESGLLDGLPGGDEADHERIRFPPLVRDYARDLFEGKRTAGGDRSWAPTLRDKVERAISRWYVRYANSAPHLALAPDEINITGAFEWALAHHDDRAAAGICGGIMGFWRDTGRTRAGLHYLPLGAAAAGRIANRSGTREDRLRQANITACLGDILSNTGNVVDAETIFMQDLALRRASEDRGGEGMAFSRLGLIALRRGQMVEAENYFQQSLAIRREVGDRRGEGVDLSSLSQIAQQRGRLDEAEAYVQQSLAVRREVGDRHGEGVDLANLGQGALRRGQLAAAEEYYQQSLAIRREVSDRQGEGVALSNLGQIAQWRGRLEEAEAYYQQSLAIDREVSDRQGEGVDLSNLGDIAMQRGRLEEAEAYYQQSLAIDREVSDRRGEGVALSNLGQIAQWRGRLEEAEAYYQQSLAIRREVSDRQGEGVDLSNLGRISQWRGRLEEAEAYYQQSLAIDREVSDRQGEGVALSRLGEISMQRGRLEEAEAYYQQSLAIRREVSDRRGVGVVLSNLGHVAMQRGRLEEAEAYFQQDLAIRREVGDRQGEAVALSGLGQLLTQSGHIEEAEDRFQHALAINREAGDLRGEGVELTNLGRLALDRGRLEEAEEYFRQALIIDRELGDRRGEGTVQSYLGTIALRHEQWELAEVTYRVILAAAQETADVGLTASATLALGKLLIEHRSASQEGCELIGAAANIYDRMGQREQAQETREQAKALGCGP